MIKLKDFLDILKGQLIVRVLHSYNYQFLFEGYLEALKLNLNINLIYDMEVLTCLVKNDIFTIVVK